MLTRFPSYLPALLLDLCYLDPFFLETVETWFGEDEKKTKLVFSLALFVVHHHIACEGKMDGALFGMFRGRGGKHSSGYVWL